MDVKYVTVRLDCGHTRQVDFRIVRHLKKGTFSKCPEHGDVKVQGVGR